MASDRRRAPSRGFTLIELLVVISIIALLSSVVLASLNAARSKGRDATRISSALEIKKALELFYADNGHYPQSSWRSSNEGAWETGLLGTSLEPYLPTMPKDPINTVASGTVASDNKDNYVFSYFATSYPGSTPSDEQAWYMLVFNLENDNPIESSDGVWACAASSQTYPTFKRPGESGSARFHYGNDTSDPNTVTIGGQCTHF